MDLMEPLKELGFTEAESKVYLALLELGSSSAGAIISKSGLQSSVVYNCMGTLMQKGMVTYSSKKKTRIFSAVNPKHLEGILNEKERIVLDAIPILAKMSNASGNAHTVSIFEGRKAAITIFNDILYTLKKNEEHLVIGISENDSGLGDFVKRWEDKRVRNGIRKRVLIAGDAKIWLDYYRKQKFTDTRVLPNLFKVNLTINIYGPKTVLVLWGKYPIYVMVESIDIANNFRRYFELLWSSSKKAG